MFAEEYDERVVVLSLLTQLFAFKPADHVAVDTIAHLILEAGGYAQVLEHLPTKQLIDALDHLHVIFGAQLFVSWAIRVRPVHNYL